MQNGLPLLAWLPVICQHACLQSTAMWLSVLQLAKALIVLVLCPLLKWHDSMSHMTKSDLIKLKETLQDMFCLLAVRLDILSSREVIPNAPEVPYY